MESNRKEILGTFTDELLAIIQKYCDIYNLTWAEVVGSLEIVKSDCLSWMDEENDEDEKEDFGTFC